MTHTLECAQIGRAIARRSTGTPILDTVVENPEELPDLIEAACLAHDLGHPPFGHNGEKALLQMTEKHGNGLFEGNAQSFSIVTRLETKKLVGARSCGLDLTATTLRAILKYPRTETEAKNLGEPKFCIYDDAEEMEVFAWLFAGEEPTRTLATQILDVADDIAYAVHDFEDGVWSRMIPLSRLLDPDDPVRLELSAALAADEQRKKLFATADLDELMTSLFGPISSDEWARVPFDRSSYARAGLKNFSAKLIGDLIEAVTPRKRFTPPDRETRLRIGLLKQMADLWMIKSPTLETVRFGQRRLIVDLFEGYWENPQMLPERDSWQRLSSRAPARSRDRVWREKCCLIRDHVAAMTDLYALHIQSEMYGGGVAPNLRLV